MEHANSSSGRPALALDAVLRTTYLKRPRDEAELRADVFSLPVFLREHRDVRVVVVDSVALPFQKGTDDNSYSSSRVVALLMQSLAQTALASGCAVVITNNVTTKPVGSLAAAPGSGAPRMVPSMGEGFGHLSAVRLHLLWTERVRCVSVEKLIPGIAAATGALQHALPGAAEDAATLDIGSFALPFAVVAAGIRAPDFVDTET